MSSRPLKREGKERKLIGLLVGQQALWRFFFFSSQCDTCRLGTIKVFDRPKHSLSVFKSPIVMPLFEIATENQIEIKNLKGGCISNFAFLSLGNILRVHLSLFSCRVEGSDYTGP